MKWAPMAPMGLHDTPQPKYLYIRGNVVEVNLGERQTMFEYELPKPVDFAVLAWFKQREHVVAVCHNMVHAFDISAGRTPATIGLPFAPSVVFGSKEGLVLGGLQGKFYLMTDPFVLLGTLASSSLDTLMGEMVHFGDGMAVIYHAQALHLFTVRVLPPSKGLNPRGNGNASAASTGRGHSNSVSRRSLLSGISGVAPDALGDASMASFAAGTGSTTNALKRNDIVTQQGHSHIPKQQLLATEQRAALLTRVTTINIDGGCAAYDLEVFVQRRAGEFAVAIRLASRNYLYVYSSAGGGEVYERENITSIAPLRGFVDGRYPMVVTGGRIWSLFFPDLERLIIPLDPKVFTFPPAADSEGSSLGPLLLADVIVDKNSVAGNAFTFHVPGLTAQQRLLLVAVDGGVISNCLRLLEAAQGPGTVAQVLVELAASLHDYDGLLEDRSRQAFVHLIETNANSFTPQYMLYLRMLQSEFSLGALEHVECLFLGKLIERYEIARGSKVGELVKYFNIYEVLESKLDGTDSSYPAPPFITREGENKDLFWRSRALLAFFDLLADQPLVESMRSLFDKFELVKNLNCFAPGVRIILREVAAYIAYTPSSRSYTIARPRLGTPNDDLLTISRWLFCKDKRFDEARSLVQNVKPRAIILDKPAGIIEHVWAQKQEIAAFNYGEMAFARSFGRAAIEIGSVSPSIVAPLKTPAVDFGVEIGNLGVSLKPVVFESKWGEFAHGAATGLSVVPSSGRDGNSRAWTVDVASNVDAGMIYGLGLMGHLKQLEEWHIYRYLEAKNPTLSTGVLLGLAASRRGSMDPKITKVLSVHINALLPVGAHDLQVAPEVQNAAIIALGLLYYKTGHRRMSETVLMALEDDKKDEEYRLAAGIALGLIRCSAVNDQMLVVDVRDRLLSLVNRPHDRYANLFSTDENPNIDDPTGSSAGAIVALLLIFVGTNNNVLADHLKPPQTLEAARYVRPDLLFGRCLSRTLMMWDSVGKTEDWLLSQMPSSLNSEEGLLWHAYGLTGLLVSMGLRYASTNDEQVISLLLSYSDKYTSNVPGDLSTYKSSVSGMVLWKLNCSVLLAAAAVASGSGNLEILKRLRARLRPRPWGTFQTSGTSNCKVGGYGPLALGIGWLFMGGGQWSFKTDSDSVALLALAFVPMLGGSSVEAENWEHIRHMWALSAEKRCVVVRDDSRGGELLEGVKVNVELASTGEVSSLTSPALLPAMKDVASVTLADSRYLQLKTDWTRELALDVRPKKLSGTIGEMFDTQEVAKSDADHDFAAMRSIATTSSAIYEEWGLRLLFTFCDSWLPKEELLSVPRRNIDYLKACKWLQTREQKDSDATSGDASTTS